MNKRFVNIKEIQEVLKEIERLNIKLKSYPYMHCRICGDTKPKHGFYPMYAMSIGDGIYQTSSVTCNRCSYSDDTYRNIFNEEKEIIELNEK